MWAGKEVKYISGRSVWGVIEAKYIPGLLFVGAKRYSSRIYYLPFTIRNSTLTKFAHHLFHRFLAAGK